MDQTAVKCGNKSRKSPSGQKEEKSDGKVVQEESTGGINLREESEVNLDMGLDNLCQEAGKQETDIQGGECHPPVS